MKTKVIAAAALTLGMVSGAIAQTTVIYDDKAIMGPFFTDDAMTTMRSDDEIRTAFTQLSPENQQKMVEDCKKPDQYQDQFWFGLCDKISAQ